MNLRILILVSALTGNAFPQGPLTPPPGVPAPTMKTLDQVEPSSPLVADVSGVAIAPSGTITISQPGAYHLTANLTVTSGNGITITSDGVTLDLRGFTIATTGSGGIGISISGRTRISIRNGHIRSGTTFTAPSTFTSAGFSGGIDYSAGLPGIIRISDVGIEGVQNYGIDLGTSLAGIVESCVVRIAQFNGIRAGVVSDSVALLIGETPIIADAIDNCVGRKIDGAAINTKEEKRTPISTAPFTITQPGSYYLTQNLTVPSGNAILINAGGVTLDLNGFRISSSASPAAGNAIEIPSENSIVGGIVIRNGHIGRANPNETGSGFAQGVYCFTIFNFSVECEGLHVMDTKVAGINLGIGNDPRSIVRNCLVRNIGTSTLAESYGIFAHVIRDCTVVCNDGDALFGVSVDNCVATSTLGRGIVGRTIENSVGKGNGNGIFGTAVVRGSVGTATIGIGVNSPIVTDCQGEATTGTAISGRQISNCFAKTTTGIGINTTGTASYCRIEVNSGTVAITGPHAFSCTVSAGALNMATNKNFCY